MSIVTIIGSGMMGSALAFPARENGHEVRLVGTPLDRDIIDHARKTDQHLKFDRPFPKGIKYYQVEEMDEAIKGSTFIIGGVSSFGVDWFAENVLPRVPNEIPIISVTKGLMNTPDGKLLCYPELWRAALDKLGKTNELCAIGGPCTSYELVAHDQSLVAYCGANMATLEMMKATMTTDYYHIMTTTDLIGIESAVALKNGYALGIALTIGENIKKSGNEDEIPAGVARNERADEHAGRHAEQLFRRRRRLVCNGLRRPHAEGRHPARQRAEHRRSAERVERRDAGIAGRGVARREGVEGEGREGRNRSGGLPVADACR